MPLRIDREDHVVVITIDNPPLNLFPDEYIDELRRIIDGLADDGDTHVALITGSGTRAFTAGKDVSEHKFTLDPARDNPRAVRNYIQAIVDCAVPVIAAVNGVCLGHGIAITAAADIVLASTNARFGLPEINIGSGNGQRLMRELFPRGHARHAFYTGEYISAEEAYRVGAVFSLHEPDDLMEEAMRLARTIASKSPSMMRMFKDTVRWTEHLDMETGYRFEGEAWYALKRDALAAAEMIEAKQSFFEKRPARFDEVRESFRRGED